MGLMFQLQSGLPALENSGIYNALSTVLLMIASSHLILHYEFLREEVECDVFS